MSSLSNLTPVTDVCNSPESRVRVEQGNTSFQKGKEFRTFLEIIKPAADVWFLRFANPIGVILTGVRINLDSGAARYSTVASPVFTGVWTPLLAINLNSTLAVIPAPQTVVDWAVAPTGNVTFSGERDIVRVRAGSSQGNNSPISAVGSTLQRGLAAGTHAIRIGPITGVANADPVNGVIELTWSELPEV